MARASRALLGSLERVERAKLLARQSKDLMRAVLERLRRRQG